MQRRFRELIRALRDELDGLERLVELARRENAALIGNDREGFLAVIKDQERVVSEMADLDGARAKVVARLSESLGLRATSTLLEICHALDGEMACTARALHCELSAAAIRLSELNRSNDLLVRQSLEQTRHAISFLSSQLQAHDPVGVSVGHGRTGPGGMGLVNSQA